MSFTEHNVNGLIYDTSDVITAAGSGAVHAFTTRHGGVSPAPYDSLNFADNKGDTSENLLENYRRLGEAVGFDASRAVGCRQIHSDLVRIASEEDAGKILWDDRPYDADGLITNVPNLPLFAYGTDCCVITLYDPTSRSIGAVHAGWRGTASGIALKAAVSMMSCYGADPYLVSGREPKCPPVMREVKESHQMDWVRACKEDADDRTLSASDFSEAGPFNEMVVMGVLAVRLQGLNQELHWDGEKMRFTNIPADATIKTVIKDGFSIKDGHPTFKKTWTDPVNANQFAEELIKHNYREGWKLPDMPM